MTKPKTEIVVGDYYDRPNITLYERETPSFEARIALSMVEKWGIVAATTDGEDTAGRAKLRPLTPAELVERACTTADLLATELRTRGWMLELPSLEEAIAAKKTRSVA